MANTDFLNGTGLGYLISKIKAAFVAKADTQAVTAIDIDATPTASSNNLVKSGGVYSALSDKQDAIVFNTAYNASSNKAATMSDIPSTSGLESANNKVTSLSFQSTDTQYPSAKCVYDLVGDIETLLAAI